jgi:NADH-quinone oxidoreductase subunit N
MEAVAIPTVYPVVVAPMTTIFAWATVLLLIDVFLIPQKSKRVTGYLALAGLLVTALVSVWVQFFIPVGPETRATLFGTPGGMVVMDSFSLTLTWVFLVIAAITIMISLDYLPRHNIEMGEFYVLVLFATGGMVLLAQSTNLIMMFMAIELLSLTLYILTAFFYPRMSSQEAGMKYLLLGAFAAGFFVYGIALFYGGAGTVDLAAIRAYLLNNPPLVDGSLTTGSGLVLIGSGLLLVAFGFKVALVPFHMWTPDVYEGSPTPVAAFMSVGTKGAALAALLRVMLALPTMQQFWLAMLGGLAMATMLIGNLGAIAQVNVKRMLAYSSIGHAGYILLGIMAASNHGTESFLFYIMAYVLTNMGAFAVLIALERRGEQAWSLDDFSGLWKRQPLLAIAMAIFMLSLAGVPPTAGFFAKFLVFAAAWESDLRVLALVGVLTSAIAVFFYLRIIVRMFMHEPVRDTSPLLYRGLTFSIGLTAVGTMLFGLLPTLVVDLVQRSVVALGG